MKQRGLDASNKEAPVGFFERLRMGNIDDPNSEAYKKFGAGRGRAEAVTAETAAAGPAAGSSSIRDPQQMAEQKAAPKAAPKASDGDVDERDRRLEAAANAPSRMPTRPGQSSSGRNRRGSAASTKDESTPVNRARYTPKDSTPRQYMSPSYMRNLMREDMEKERAEIQPQRREEQKAAQRNKAEPNKYTRPNEASSASNGSKFNANDALQTGVALASLYPAARTGKMIYQAGKKAYQGYKATKTATTGAKSPLREKTERLIREDKNPGRSVSQAPASPKVSLKEKTKELIQGDRTAKSNELSRQMAEKQKPTKFTSKKSTSAGKPVASKRTKKFNEEEAGIEFKRGGKIGASSASKRADGCAQRGKTRGRVY
jgi:hypothetical protein